MDLQLIKACLTRSSYDKLHHRIKPELVSSSTYTMLAWVRSAYKSNPELQALTPDDLIAYVTLRCENRLEDAGVRLVLKQCEKLKQVEDVPTSILLDTLVQEELVGKVGAVVQKWNAGKEVEPHKEISHLLKEYDIKPREEIKEYDINDLLNSIDNHEGVTFNRLKYDLTEVPLLEKYVQPLIEGSTIALGSRTGKGKSTQVAYLATRCAKSCYEYFGEDRPIIIGVNEGNFKRAVPRMYQSALAMTPSEIIELSNQGRLNKMFEEVVGVPHNYIRYVPMYGWDVTKFEEFIDTTKPSMLWLDMLEHLQPPTHMEENAKLKYLAEFMRYINLSYEMIGAFTIQLGAEAENDLYPKESTISYSKTAVQAVSELTLMMGALDSPDQVDTRGWSIAKSKFGVEGKPSLVHDVLRFDSERGLFSLM